MLLQSYRIYPIIVESILCEQCSGKSKNFHFNGLLLSKVCNVWATKIWGVVSWKKTYEKKMKNFFFQKIFLFRALSWKTTCEKKMKNFFFSKDIPIPWVYYLLLQRFLYLLATKVKLRWEIIFCNRQILNEIALILKTDVSTCGAEKRGIKKLLNSKRI